MKLHHVRVSMAGGLAFLALLAGTCLAQPGPPAVRLTFEKWLAIAGPAPDVATFEGSSMAMSRAG